MAVSTEIRVLFGFAQKPQAAKDVKYQGANIMPEY